MNRSLETAVVADAMTREVFTLQATHSWEEAATKMLTRGVHHLVLVDADHRPVGVLSSFDFLAVSLRKDAGLLKKSIGETKTERPPLSVRPNTPLYDAARRLQSHHVDSLVVVGDSGLVEGILTSKDIVNALFEDGYRPG